MNDVKEKLRGFVKEESKGMNLIINGVIFGWTFFDNVGKDGFVGAFFGAAMITIIVAAFTHFVARPYIIPAINSFLKR